MLPLSWFKQHYDFESNPGRRHELVLVPVFLAAFGICVLSLSLIAANTVAVAGYLQPLLVATYLAVCSALFTGRRRWMRIQVTGLLLAILLGSVRAVGMSTWGLACAADMGYTKANQRVETELANHSEGYRVAMSSAFLYGAVKHHEITFVHCDWMERAKGDSRVTDLRGLIQLKPHKMILTQYDYYRRFAAVLEKAKDDPGLKDLQIINTAVTRAPDSFPAFRQVVQHISWAPVIVTFTWRE